MPLEELKKIVGPGAWTTDAAELEPHLSEPRGLLTGRTSIMLSPDNTEQVSAIVSTCAKAGVSIVPQGGNTGLCGGATPDESGDQVLLSLSRLNKIRSVDPDDYSMTVDAGCILANVQDAARNVDRLFPLSLGAEGSCQIGGNLSTNAGGINVIRYGSARQQVLGLEVVLADGTIWNGLRALRKDSGGYDMKQIFIGSEGTLGIITAATLRLFPAHADSSIALVALKSMVDAMQLLTRLRVACAEQIVAFEMMTDTAYGLAMRHGSNVTSPFKESYPCYALIDVSSGGADSALELALSEAISDGQVLDAVIAKNSNEAGRLWRIRHAIPEAQGKEGVSIKHDISVPIGRIDDFMRQAEAAILKQIPDARIVAFGHLGDGNLHYNISQPIGADPDEFRKVAVAASKAVYDLVADLGGSFSAEHGVGVLKKAYLHEYRSSEELDLMRTLKQAMDPQNTLNPGKVI
jgi:FAD/FMN-containing dehydrogenase